MNLSYFSQKDFYRSLKQFFSDLNIPINPVTEAPDSADSILPDTYNANNPAHKLMDDVYFVGMVSEEAFSKQGAIKYSTAAQDIKTKDYDCMLLFGVTLKAGHTPSRSQLAEITRAFNRQFSYYPVVVIFKYGESIAFANCERLAYKQAWREGEKAGKVSLLKDISVANPHSGHLRILQSLDIARSGSKAITTFAGLYKHWQDIFSVNVLNKSFYQELSNWYFWALSEISFPDDSEKNDEVRTAENTIRLITRLIFVWFLKEKGLVPGELFDKNEVDKLLDYRKDKTGSAYYRAILQNLFFATLNVPMDEREFRDEKRFQGKNDDYMNHRVYRYADLFKKANSFETLFGKIPFLNGGLFDCLDYRDEKGKEVRIDCYSDNPKNAVRLTVPDKLFFGSDVVDLSEIYDDKKKKEVPVRGIIDILNSYKFTIAENTPVEEEIALDPELLGRVFENLLASYNPETQTTARKQTGSFYTPREIVNYMVDESLKAYLATTLGDDEATKNMLDQVLDYGDDLPELTDKQRQQIIAALEDAKILDPACGSGAFPMGILQKMVRVLEKLDPKNERWKQALIRRTPIEARKEMETILAGNTADYSRKLGIIQNCIYGVDIQPIAIQVSKLRFFISLLVDFSVDKSKHNFGIQPLPNLDYKLMQGNSLIEDFHGFTLNLKEQDTDDNSGHLFCDNSKVVSLIEDLWEKQAEYLRESRPKQKEKLREEVEKDIVNIFDTYIRLKMKEYFGALNSIESRAKQIPNEKTREDYLKAEKAKLDKKYNFDYVAVEKELKHFTHGIKPRSFFPWQLYFTDVFKKKGGFDIVIGNPPWGAKLDKDDKLKLKEQFHEIDSSTPNSFAYFIGLSNRLSKIISLVLPDSILIKDFAKTRQLIKDRLTEIIWYQNTAVPEDVRPFIYVEHDVCVINISSENHEMLNCRKYIYDSNAKSMKEIQWIEQKNKLIFEEYEYAFNLMLNNDDLEIHNKLKKHNKIETYLQCHEGIHTGNARDILFKKGKTNKHCKPLYYGGGAGDPICNYHSKMSGWYVDYRKEIIDKDAGFYASLRDEKIFSKAKIYISRTGNPFKAFIDNDNYASNNFFSLQFKDYDVNDINELKIILAFINAKISQYFIRKFAAPRLGDTFVETKILHLLKIRIPAIDNSNKQKILTLVDKIIACKDEDITNDTSALESKIDRLVYQLYGLTDEEIAVVEGRT